MSARRNPKVSVVIPCYNYGRFLVACVHSVLQQNGVNLEVVIIDDASADRTWEIAQELARVDSRVKCLRNAENRGMISTINASMWEVDGDYIVKLDADDLLTPGSLERAVDLLEAEPALAFAYGAPIYFWDEEVPQARTKVTGWTIWDGEQWLRWRCESATNCIGQPEAVIRRAALMVAGHYNEDLAHTSDFEMWLRLSQLGEVGWIRGADQGLMRVHAGSMQQTIHRGRIVDLRGRHAAFQSFFSKNGSNLPDAAALYRRATRALADEALGLACSAYKHRIAANETVGSYITFASDIYPEFEGLRSWRELANRIDLGVTRSALAPTLLAEAMLRRLRGARASRRRRKSGR